MNSYSEILKFTLKTHGERIHCGSVETPAKEPENQQGKEKGQHSYMSLSPNSTVFKAEKAGNLKEETQDTTFFEGYTEVGQSPFADRYIPKRKLVKKESMMS